MISTSLFHRLKNKLRFGALVALMPLAARAASFNVTLQGQDATAPGSHIATGVYAGGAQDNWQELDTIPFRVLLANSSGSTLANQIVTVSFDHQKTIGGTTKPGI